MVEASDLHNKSRDELITLVQNLDERCDRLSAENEKMWQFLADLKRRQFGRSSEKLDNDQCQFQLEDVEQSASAADVQAEEAWTAEDGKQQAREHNAERQRHTSGRKRNRGQLPGHLEREDVYLPPENEACSCCGGELHVIGEDVSEQLDYRPAQLIAKRFHRPRCGCRQCEGTVEQAQAPDRLLTGGMATAGLIAHVLVSKYADHLPLYRQAEIFQRQGIELDRATLANWVGRAAWFLEPVADVIHDHVRAAERVFADETPLPVLEPGRGKTKTGYVWTYARDDGPFAGTASPAVSYRYEPDRKAQNPRFHLESYTGILQADAYQGYKRLLEDPDKEGLQLVLCWAHLRRQAYDVHKATGSPIAAAILERIQALYAIEAEIRGWPPEERRQYRDAHSRPLIEAMKPWLEQQLAGLPGKSKLAQTIRYALSRWSRFTAFLQDGRIDLDTNTVERTIRPITLGRKNALFAGSDKGGHHWAVIASLIHTAKLNGVEPHGYLRDVLERFLDGRTTINRVKEVLPWAYPAELPRATA